MNYKFYDDCCSDIIFSSENELRNIYLAHRGVKDINKYCDTNDSSREHNWDCFDGKEENAKMKSAVANILNAINEERTIGIIVDCDCDGYLSSAIMYKYLCEVCCRLGKNSKIEYILHKTPKSHNLSDFFDKNERVVSFGKNIDFLIVPDAGTNDVPECKYIKEDMGIDIIILDHHEITTDNKYATIINNQRENSLNKNICGAGVVYKFICAIDDTINDGIESAEKYLDLVAVANIADIMDLREDETKYYIDNGLGRIRNKFIKALISSQGYSIEDEDNILIKDVIWKIAPLINGMVRCGKEEEKDIMFKALVDIYDEWEQKKRDGSIIIEDVYERAARLCKNAHSRQSNAVKKIIEHFDTCSDKENKTFVCDVGNICDSEYTGLVANKLTDVYNKPIVLVRKTDNGTYAGSVRCPKLFNGNFRDTVQSCKTVISANGHASAFGIEITDINGFQKEVNELLKDYNFEKVIYVDCKMSAEDITSDMVIESNNLKKYEGNEISPIKVYVEDLTIKDEVELLKNNTIKFLYNGVSYLIFKLPNGSELLKWVNSRWDENSYVVCDVIGTPSVNYYEGNMNIQFVIDDFDIKKVQKSDEDYIDEEW